MKRLQSILCASVLTLAVSSSAFAGNITGRAGNITGGTGNITGGTGNITGAPGNITGAPDLSLRDIMGIMLHEISLLIP